jgi:hypothetical protein
MGFSFDCQENIPLRKEVIMEADQDDEIDPELWLQALLAMTADKDRKEEIIQRISKKTGQIPENVEKILSTLINILANKARSN